MLYMFIDYVLARLYIACKLFGICVLPFTVIPVIIHAFFSSHATLFARLVVILVYSLVIPFPRRFLLLRIVTNVIIAFDLESLCRHSRLVHYTFFVFVSCTLYCVDLSVCRRTSFGGVG